MPGVDVQQPGLGTDFAAGRRQVWMTFRDSTGVGWRAASDGPLTEIQGG